MRFDPSFLPSPVDRDQVAGSRALKYCVAVIRFEEGMDMQGSARTWVVVAEAGRARIFRQEHPGADLEELEDLLNPEARARERELTSDDHGRTFDSRGAGRHAKEPKVSAKKQGEQEFANEICRLVEEARNAKEFDRLILVAAPEFLGLLRKNLSRDADRLTTREIQKNLVREDREIILSQLAP